MRIHVAMDGILHHAIWSTPLRLVRRETRWYRRHRCHRALLRSNPVAAMLARATHLRIVDGRIVGTHSVASPQWNAVVRCARVNSAKQPSLTGGAVHAGATWFRSCACLR